MKAELLAPAGNPAKLASALYFGADAVYIGGKAFSLRSFADNFSESELSVERCISAEKRVKPVKNKSRLSFSIFLRSGFMIIGVTVYSFAAKSILFNPPNDAAI